MTIAPKGKYSPSVTSTSSKDFSKRLPTSLSWRDSVLKSFVSETRIPNTGTDMIGIGMQIKIGKERRIGMGIGFGIGIRVGSRIWIGVGERIKIAVGIRIETGIGMGIG